MNRPGSASTISRPTRCMATWGTPPGFYRKHPVCTKFTLLRKQGKCRPPGPGMVPDLRTANGSDELLEQLRPLPVPGETHPAHDPQRPGGQAPPDIRERRSGPGLALRRRPRPCPLPGGHRRERWGRPTTSAGMPKSRTSRLCRRSVNSSKNWLPISLRASSITAT
jgi:hypothetical protein